MIPLRLLCGALALMHACEAAAAELRLVLVRESLTGIHRYYQQSIGGVDVAGAMRVESIRRDGTRQVFDRLARTSEDAAVAQRSDGASLLWIDGVARRVRRSVVAEKPFEHYAIYTDATGEVVLREPLFYRASGRAFPVNPVAATNDPSLQDRNDSAAAVPPSAYRAVELPDLVPSGPLSGPHVTIVDRESPATPRADAAQPLDFDRSQPQFEEVNVYYAIDRNQRYLQSLGYTGARRVVGYAIPVDPHAIGGADASYYLQTSNRGEGVLLFGDGGTDDAEDSDLVLHEYAHAIHDWIAPGALGGGPSAESRALGEGFGDYWAYSATYAETIASGRDPACLADWDARCWESDGSQQCGYPRGSDCLRRTDSRKTMADFVAGDTAGTEHRNGEIWSSALREIFLSLIDRHGFEQGKRIADTIVIESLFGLPPNPTFRAVAGRMLDADRLLQGGSHRLTICAAMSARGILPAEACEVRPRGEITYFQSGDHGRAIPDFDGRGVVSRVRIDDPRAIENLYVRVDIDHPNRGDLEVVLIAPDGTEVVLHRPSLDRSRDLRATFGLDTQPAQPLTIFRGRSAAGEWRLRVVDTLLSDAGTLVSWSLVVQFAGETPATERPVSSKRKSIAAAAHAPGANGTLFTTDLRLFNRGPRTANVTLVFTPSGADGRTAFSAFRVAIAPRQIVAFDDVVLRQFQTLGTGAIEIGGDVDDVIVTSRTSTPDGGGGSRGQFAGSVDAGASAGSGVLLFVPHLRHDTEFRSNVGFAETAGFAGMVRVRWFTSDGGAPAREATYAIAPFGHLQIASPIDGAATAELTVISGQARIAAYGSVVDNRSGDAIFIPAIGVPPRSSEVAPAIDAPGALGTFWRTELRLTSVTDLEIAGVASIAFTDAKDGRTSTTSVFLPGPRQSVVVPVTMGEIGVLRIDLPAGFVATSRIVTASGAGSFGQFVPFRSSGATDVIHLENSTRFRTNVGVINGGTAPVSVTLVAYDAAGTELGGRVVTLGPRGLAQIPLASFASGAIVNARVTMIAPDGVMLYASVIDNVTGDPMFVPAQ